MDQALPSPQEASGTSIFWALTTIVLNAMLQLSYVGILTSGTTFEGTLWPLRASPLVCLLDAAVELRICFADSAWQDELPDEQQHDVKPTANATSMVMKLAIFMLGVLPQAIKLFSMGGIPVTQVLASIFIFSSLVNMLRSFKPNADQDMRRFVEYTKSKATLLGHEGIHFLFWLIHGVSLSVLYYYLSNLLHIPTTNENFKNGLVLVHAPIFTAGVIYTAQHFAFVILNLRPVIPRYPSVILFLCTDMLAIPSLLKNNPCCRRPTSRDISFVLEIVLTLAVVSYVVAWVVWTLARKIMRSDLDHEAIMVHAMTEVITAEEELTMEEVVDDELGTNELDIQEPVSVQIEAGLNSSNATSEDTTAPSAEETTAEATADSTSPHEPPQASEEKQDEQLGVLGWMFVVFFCIIWIPAILIGEYSGAWTPFTRTDAESEEHITQQGEIEEARPTSHTFFVKISDMCHSLTPRRIFWAAQWPLRFVLSIVLIFIGRFYRAFGSLFIYSMEWYWKAAMSRDRDILVLAFGLANFVTIGVVYLCVWNGEGTSSPSWNSALG